MKKNIFFLLTLFMGLLTTHMPATASWFCCSSGAVNKGEDAPEGPEASQSMARSGTPSPQGNPIELRNRQLAEHLSQTPSPRAIPLEQLQANKLRPVRGAAQPRIFYQPSSEESQAQASWPATVRLPALKDRLEEHLSLSKSPQAHDLGPSEETGWTLVQLPPAPVQESGLKRTQAERNLHLLLHRARADEGKIDEREFSQPAATSFWLPAQRPKTMQELTLSEGFRFTPPHLVASGRTPQSNVRIPRNIETIQLQRAPGSYVAPKIEVEKEPK